MQIFTIQLFPALLPFISEGIPVLYSLFRSYLADKWINISIFLFNVLGENIWNGPEVYITQNQNRISYKTSCFCDKRVENSLNNVFLHLIVLSSHFKDEVVPVC